MKAFDRAKERGGEGSHLKYFLRRLHMLKSDLLYGLLTTNPAPIPDF